MPIAIATRQTQPHLAKPLLALALLVCLCFSPSQAQSPGTEEPPAAEQDTEPSTADTPAATEDDAADDSPPTAPAIPPRPEPVLLGITPKTLYADALPEESQWLETSEGKILSLYRATENPVTKGALLLLHTAEDPLLWPPELENLRRYLPRYGWETLAISLPQPLAHKPPARELPPPVAATETSPETENTTGQQPASSEASANTSRSQTTSSPSDNTAAIPREQLIQAYLLAAIKFLNDQGQFNLIILVDNSALYWTMQLLSPAMKVNQQDNNRLEGPLQALVIANLQPQEPLSSAQLASSFSQPQLPILDIFFAPDNNLQQQARAKHRALAMRNKLRHYHALVLGQQPKTAETDSSSFLLGRVRGFMENKARGVEVKDAKVIHTP